MGSTPTTEPTPMPFTETPTRLDSISPSGIPSLGPTIKQPVLTNKPVIPTESPTKICPWKDYIGNCREFDIFLGDGDCKFNPGSRPSICAFNVISRCEWWLRQGYSCVAKC